MIWNRYRLRAFVGPFSSSSSLNPLLNPHTKFAPKFSEFFCSAVDSNFYDDIPSVWRIELASATWFHVDAHLMKKLHISISHGGYFSCNKRFKSLKKAVVSPFYCSTTRYSGNQIGRFLGILSDDSHPILKDNWLQHWFKNWQHLRKHKLTASTFGMAVGFWPSGRLKLWLEKLGLIEPFYGNSATCWNNIKEEEALERYKLITGNPISFPEFQVHGKKNPEDIWFAPFS